MLCLSLPLVHLHSSGSPIYYFAVHQGWLTVVSAAGCLSACTHPAAGFEQLAAKFDFSRYKTLGDIGGSAGALCCTLAKAHPHLTCTTLDLPAVHAAAEQYVAQQGLADRVKVCVYVGGVCSTGARDTRWQ